MSGRERSLTPEQIIKALIDMNGMISKAARSLGVSRSLIYWYMDQHPEIREAVDEAKQMMLDEAESQLHKAVKKGTPWAVQYYLKTQGKQRGYVDRQEITGADGEAIQIKAELKDLEGKTPKEISQMYQELSRGSSSSK
jgi:transposase-like protein